MSEICSSAGAFVIGALEPEEDRLFADHLEQCEDCEREVGELAGLTAFTHGIELDPQVLDELIRPETPVAEPTTVRFLRRRSVLVGLGAVLVAAAIATFAVFGTLNGATPDPAPVAIAMDRTFANTGASTIRVQVTAAENASSINVLCSIAAASGGGGYRTDRVSLWVHTRSGSELEVTSWPVHEGTMSFPGEVPVTPDQIDLFELRDQAGTVLNTMPV